MRRCTVQPDKLCHTGRTFCSVNHQRVGETKDFPIVRDNRLWIPLVIVTAVLSACADLQVGMARKPMPREASPPPAAPQIAVSALDPLDAPPPPAASVPASPTADPLLVPPAAQASQRVPLGTLGPATPAAQPQAASAQAQGTPTRLTPQTPSQAVPASGSSSASTLVAAVPPASVAPVPPPAAPPAAAVPASTASVPPSTGREAPALPAAPAAAEPQSPAPASTAPTTSPSVVLPAPVQARVAQSVPAPTPPAAAARDEEATVIISSATAPPAEAREFVPAAVVPVAAPSVPPVLGEMPFSKAEQNIARRFETLMRLEDEGLITQDEFNRRRAANLGALLPYSQDPPSVGLDRAVPSSDAIAARLTALRRAFEMRAITSQQHALERTMILNALLPENPESRTVRRPPPADVIEGAAMVGHLEVLRENGVITAQELDAERKMIDAVLRTGLFPPKGGAAEPRREAASAAAPPAAVPPPAASDNPMEREITGPVLHLASFRSEASAKQAWQEVLQRNSATLGASKAIIRRVDLGRERGIFYRLMTGSFASMAEAEAVCVKLKQNNQFCRASADGN